MVLNVGAMMESNCLLCAICACVALIVWWHTSLIDHPVPLHKGKQRCYFGDGRSNYPLRWTMPKPRLLSALALRDILLSPSSMSFGTRSTYSRSRLHWFTYFGDGVLVLVDCVEVDVLECVWDLVITVCDKRWNTKHVQYVVSSLVGGNEQDSLLLIPGILSHDLRSKIQSFI